MKKTCETCAAFLATKNGWGECRLNPPQAVTDGGTYDPGYDSDPEIRVCSSFEVPDVPEDFYCLQWRKKEDEDHAD